MYARTHAVAVVGIRGHPVAVEAHVGRGLPSLHVTGLPGAGIQDARERVRPAVENAGLEWPLRRVTVNLSPAGLRKDGPGFDLPIAAAVLCATGQVREERLTPYALVGELSLKGALLPTPGVLAVAAAAAGAGFRGVVVPEGNAAEAALVDGLEVVAAPSLAKVVEFARGQWSPDAPRSVPDEGPPAHDVDFSEIRGQVESRRALEIAAAGGHNVLLVGPPGAGKTMLARRLPTILPEMSRDEALEVTGLHSIAGLLRPGSGLVTARPFRSPHQSISAAGLLGGGSALIRPGEVSLAHHGVLFLDEREPRGELDGAAANPCPCGFDGDARRRCRCLEHRLEAYRQRLSGPLLDRIDIRLRVARLSKSELLGAQLGESSAAIRARVDSARERARSRFRGTRVRCNAEMSGGQARRVVELTAGAERLIARAVDRYALTGRGFDRALKVARTIADLAGSERTEEPHVLEALSFRGDVADTRDVA